MTIKVLVVDDSVLMRKVLTEIISTAPDMEVVGTAPDPLAAREMIKTVNPDVLTLDVEMPRMDGLEFLRRLMQLRPMPVVMISSLTEAGSDTSLRALELGAVDVIAKPRIDAPGRIQEYATDICDKIRAAFGARLRPLASAPVVAPAAPPAQFGNARLAAEKLILIGASTGGTEAIKEVLMGMPEGCPGIVMVQHMPELFTASFAKRLDSTCRIRVKEATHGERVQPGHAYLAPGHSHLSVRRSAGGWVCELSQGEPVNRHRPSVEVLFRSAVREVGRNGIAVMLTGMGKDGAEGMKALRDAGAWTIAQDEASCVVYGMPRAAVAAGAVEEVVNLRDIAPRILTRLRESERRPARV